MDLTQMAYFIPLYTPLAAVELCLIHNGETERSTLMPGVSVKMDKKTSLGQRCRNTTFNERRNQKKVSI